MIITTKIEEQKWKPPQRLPPHGGNDLKKRTGEKLILNGVPSELGVRK